MPFPKHPFRAEIVVAWQSFAFDDPTGKSYDISRGVRLRADHPAVRANPGYFVSGLAKNETPNLRNSTSESTG